VNFAPDRAALTDGAKFTFARRPWASGDKAVGTLFETQVEPGFQGDLEWTVAAFRGAAELPVETCSIHSPRLVFIPDPTLGAGSLVVKGVRRWRCDVPIEFKLPA